MCLAVPLLLTEKKGDEGVAEMAGVKRKVNLSLLENPKVGDYVIVHSGFAIAVLDQAEAKETLSLIREYVKAEELR
jgi:hydrogenase expression/formation protein HypC